MESGRLMEGGRLIGGRLKEVGLYLQSRSRELETKWNSSTIRIAQYYFVYLFETCKLAY